MHAKGLFHGFTRLTLLIVLLQAPRGRPLPDGRPRPPLRHPSDISRDIEDTPPPPQTLLSRFELPTRGSLAPQAVGGLVVAAVIKYLDAIRKNFATAISQERKKEAADPREGEDGTRRHHTGIVRRGVCC